MAFSVSVLLSLFSCSAKNSDEVVRLDNTFYWAPELYENTIPTRAFQPFYNQHHANIERLVDREVSYVWLKSNFDIPQGLREKSLALLIPYLHYSEEVYLNGNFLGKSGTFPPNPKSEMYSAHYYFLPEEFLNKDSQNELMIRIYCLGTSEISSGVIIGENSYILEKENSISFFQSRIYMFFEGGMFAAFMLFLIMYIKRKNVYYLSFSLVNAFSLIFMTYFFASEVPWYTSSYISNLFFVKFTYCLMPHFIVFSTVSFIFSLIDYKNPMWLFITRITLTLVPSVAVCSMKDYVTLMKFSPYMLIFLYLHLAIGLIGMIYVWCKNRNRREIGLVIFCYSPVVLCFIIDNVVRYAMHINICFYFVAIGWQVSIIFFMIVLSIQFSQMAVRAEFLNEKLESEVKLKTENMQKMNLTLEEDMHRSQIDLQMAAIIQQNYLPAPNKTFDGWDISVGYEPLSVVSGDFYDFYSNNENKLEGFSLFDVSGHGLAASLVTMLSKNIVQDCFMKSKKSKKVSTILMDINKKISDEKGTVENYLTGLLFKFDEIDENGVCRITFADASHPKPLLYNSRVNTTNEVKISANQTQYGAIGLNGIEACFAESEFEMRPGDILVCYTDGLTESENAQYVQFGLRRVIQTIDSNHSSSALRIQQALIHELNTFMGEKARRDDLSIVVLKRTDNKD
ncbi:MAG: SpoIIE family protein phosphatase [Treponemataceae bacterium]|nr:SpoIIE family protein phosphatase [Treponemataceae bacterium]